MGVDEEEGFEVELDMEVKEEIYRGGEQNGNLKCRGGWRGRF